MERREKDGFLYEIRRGFGFPGNLLPLIGLTPAIDNEPVYLVKTDLSSGIRQVKGYDVSYDIYQEYPAVWPEKRH